MAPPSYTQNPSCFCGVGRLICLSILGIMMLQHLPKVVVHFLGMGTQT